MKTTSNLDYFSLCAMSVLMVFAILWMPVSAFINTIVRDHLLMDSTKLISEQHFISTLPLVIALPPTEEDSTTEDVGFLIAQLHTSNRWPVLLLNTNYGMTGNMIFGINRHGSYVILISGPCQPFYEYIQRISQQFAALALGKLHLSWNPKAKFVLPVMSACMHYKTTYLARAILSKLWLYKVTNAVVLFIESSGYSVNFLAQNETLSAEHVQLGLHTWFPYGNAKSCNPIDGTVPLRTFLLRNRSDIHQSDIFRGYVSKNFHRCPLRVLMRVKAPFVMPPSPIWLNASRMYTLIYHSGWDIGIITAIADSLNLTLVGQPAHYPGRKRVDKFAKIYDLIPELVKGTADIVIGQVLRQEVFSYSLETTRSYYSIRVSWCTPCATKYPRWTRIFRIFSVELWISLTLSTVLAVVTVVCISKYGHKIHLNEFRVYRDINGVMENVIAIWLGISVATKPRTSPLRVLFFFWVCYSFAMNTVFQAYLTSFLIDTGYEKPIKNIEEMLNASKKFGFPPSYRIFFNDPTDNVGSAILRKMVLCPQESICLKWASQYRNISTLRSEFLTEYSHSIGFSTDENNKALVCDLEDGDVVYFEAVLAVLKGNPLLQHINDVIDRIVEGGLFMQWKKLYFNSARVATKIMSSSTLGITYLSISMIHMQSAFYLLLLGHAVAFLSFMMETIWYRHRSEHSKG